MRLFVVLVSSRTSCISEVLVSRLLRMWRGEVPSSSSFADVAFSYLYFLSFMDVVLSGFSV